MTTQTDVEDRPLGRAEIAELLGVAPSTISQWIWRNIFPEHDYKIATGRLWMTSTIRRWAQETGRWPDDG